MTTKQNLAIQKIVGNGGNVTKAMLDAGYSPNTANTPQKLTESKAWKDQLGDILPDDVLLTKHKEALDAKKWNDFTGEREADHQVRLKAVELGYKLKRHLGPEIIQQFNAGEMTLEFIDKDESNSP